MLHTSTTQVFLSADPTDNELIVDNVLEGMISQEAWRLMLSAAHKIALHVSSSLTSDALCNWDMSNTPLRRYLLLVQGSDDLRPLVLAKALYDLNERLTPSFKLDESWGDLNSNLASCSKCGEAHFMTSVDGVESGCPYFCQLCGKGPFLHRGKLKVSEGMEYGGSTR